MKESITLNWLKNMAFESEINGHKLYVDASIESGGKNLGPRPKLLMLYALGGCTGMDVVSILKKMRMDFDEMQIIVEGEMATEHPKKFTGMKIIYQFKGKNLELEKIQKAVMLSQEKYCAVSANLRDSLMLDYEIKIVE